MTRMNIDQMVTRVLDLADRAAPAVATAGDYGGSFDDHLAAAAPTTREQPRTEHPPREAEYAQESKPTADRRADDESQAPDENTIRDPSLTERDRETSENPQDAQHVVAESGTSEPVSPLDEVALDAEVVPVAEGSEKSDATGDQSERPPVVRSVVENGTEASGAKSNAPVTAEGVHPTQVEVGVVNATSEVAEQDSSTAADSEHRTSEVKQAAAAVESPVTESVPAKVPQADSAQIPPVVEAPVVEEVAQSNLPRGESEHDPARSAATTFVAGEGEAANEKTKNAAPKETTVQEAATVQESATAEHTDEPQDRPPSAPPAPRPDPSTRDARKSPRRTAGQVEVEKTAQPSDVPQRAADPAPVEIPSPSSDAPSGEPRASAPQPPQPLSLTPSGATPDRIAPPLPPGSTVAAKPRQRITEAQQARFLNRVAGAFQSAQRGDGEIRIRLHPPELGSLRMQIKVEDGQLVARLETETQSARRLLLDNLPALRERLAGQDIRIERFDVDVQDQSTGNRQQQAAGEKNAQGQQQHPQNNLPQREQVDRADGDERVAVDDVVDDAGLNVVI